MDGRPLSFQCSDVSVTDRRHAGSVTGLAIVGHRLFTAGSDQRILSFEPLPRGPLKFVGPELQAESPFSCLQAIRGEDHAKAIVAAGCREETKVRLWSYDWAWHEMAADVGDAPPCPDPVEAALVGHEDCIRSVDVQKTFALSASSDATARLWDLEDASEILGLPHPACVTKALFFPGGSTCVATSCIDRTLRIWDLRANAHNPAYIMQDPEVGSDQGPKSGLAIEVGGLVAKADSKGGVRVYDTMRSGARCMAKFKLPSPVPAMQFVLDSKYLACGCRDGDLYVVRLQDLAAQAFEVQPGPTKAAITELRSTVVWERKEKRTRGSDLRTVLVFSFAKAGWSLGVLKEGHLPPTGPEEVQREPDPLLARDDSTLSPLDQVDLPPPDVAPCPELLAD